MSDDNEWYYEDVYDPDPYNPKLSTYKKPRRVLEGKADTIFGPWAITSLDHTIKNALEFGIEMGFNAGVEFGEHWGRFEDYSESYGKMTVDARNEMRLRDEAASQSISVAMDRTLFSYPYRKESNELAKEMEKIIAHKVLSGDDITMISGVSDVIQLLIKAASLDAEDTMVAMKDQHDGVIRMSLKDVVARMTTLKEKVTKK